MSSNDIEPFGFDDEEAGWIVEMVSKPVTNEQFLREFSRGDRGIWWVRPHLLAERSRRRRQARSTKNKHRR